MMVLIIILLNQLTFPALVLLGIGGMCGILLWLTRAILPTTR